ncbi:hypothetical protein [Streptomyces canus]|uniref:hypothetical protein n=1 Tax=Streptomyces canus TaxID=58343 RepID=UPI0037F24D02
MVRRTAAVIALLFVGLLAHLTVGHHGETTPVGSSELAAGNFGLPMSDSITGPGAEQSERAHAPAAQHGPTADDAALSSSRGRSGSSWSPTDAIDSPAATSAAVQQDAPTVRPALARTARHTCNPATGVAPTPDSLQTFRC